MALITLDDLDFQLRLDLEKLADRASTIILRHVKREDAPWTEADAPEDVKAAALMVARNLWDETEQPLSEPVVNLLRGRRDPTLA
jgi:N-acetylmuramic acid 6-phosphate (MurNAc-6-P) etherase